CHVSWCPVVSSVTTGVVTGPLVKPPPGLPLTRTGWRTLLSPRGARERPAGESAAALLCLLAAFAPAGGPGCAKRLILLQHVGDGRIGGHVGRIEDHRVGRGLERRLRAGTVARIAFPDIAQKTLNCNRVSFVDQLLIPAARPGLVARGQVDLQPGVRKYDGSHVPPLGHQSGRGAERPLPGQQRRAHPRQDGHFGSQRTYLLGAYRLANILAGQESPSVREAQLEPVGKRGEPR